ncbi:unnamed protein product [Phytophthora fragariaefolia]|uniref:Unnamed protein product n=1 Tax=Phytophthora fragariaefolia TaxID=1490495 RepID=A0A9W6XRP9_9STRA|nr:unnamed protein product [Phytophthora fragariaefolia]
MDMRGKKRLTRATVEALRKHHKEERIKATGEADPSERWGAAALRQLQSTEASDTSVLSEVLPQLDAEDEELESCGSDSDYEDNVLGVMAATKTWGEDGKGDEEEEEDIGEEEDAESGSDEAEDNGDGEVSGVAQKRHRKGHWKETYKLKAVRTEKPVVSEFARGAFIECFPIRWASWQDFHVAVDAFQVKTYQLFACRTSTSVPSRTKPMMNTVNREAAKTGEDRKAVEKRKGTRYIQEEWNQYCKTLKCTHAPAQQPRGSGKRKHQKVCFTKCTAQVNARVTSDSSGWYITVKASVKHNQHVTKHQWYNYAENRTIDDEHLTRDVA